jgi:hypothetical protein
MKREQPLFCHTFDCLTRLLKICSARRMYLTEDTLPPDSFNHETMADALVCASEGRVPARKFHLQRKCFSHTCVAVNFITRKPWSCGATARQGLKHYPVDRQSSMVFAQHTSFSNVKRMFVPPVFGTCRKTAQAHCGGATSNSNAGVRRTQANNKDPRINSCIMR